MTQPSNPSPRRIGAPPSTPPASGERVTLATPHTHAGQHYAAGSILTVDAPTAAWLRRVGVVKTTAAPATVKE